MKSEWNINRTFIEFFVVSMKGKLVVLFNGFPKKDSKDTEKGNRQSGTINERLLSRQKIKIMEKYKEVENFDELIELEHGQIGTESRNTYEEGAQMFIISEMLKSARKEANLTQEQLADKAGTKKSYISKLENGKGNIQLSTLIRIFEQGLNRRIGLTFL